MLIPSSPLLSSPLLSEGDGAGDESPGESPRPPGAPCPAGLASPAPRAAVRPRRPPRPVPGGAQLLPQEQEEVEAGE